MSKREDLEVAMINLIAYQMEILNEIMCQVECYKVTDDEHIKDQAIQRIEVLLGEAIYDC